MTLTAPPQVRAAVQKISLGLFNLVFPEDCRVCEKPLTGVSRIPVCPDCLKQAQPLQAEHFCVCCRAPFANAFPLDEEGKCGLCRQGLNGFDQAYSFGFYEGVLRDLIVLFKYSNLPVLAKPLGEFLSRALPRDQQFDVIVPMPMHWLRRWRRGFNQAGLLAAEVSRRTGLPCRPLIARRKATAPQAGLTGARRRANVAGAFRVSRPERVRGQRILLIDDVLTTGATAGACASALRRAGAASVTILTVARADRRSSVPAAVVSSSSFLFQPHGSLADGKSGSLA